MWDTAIDEAVRAGANTVSGPAFGLRDPSEARREALTLAVREARDKADAIARAAGLHPVPTPIEPGTISVVAA